MEYKFLKILSMFSDIYFKVINCISNEMALKGEEGVMEIRFVLNGKRT